MNQEEIDRLASLIRATPIAAAGPTLGLPAFLMSPEGGRELEDHIAEQLRGAGNQGDFDVYRPSEAEAAQIEAIRRTFMPLQGLIAGAGIGIGAGVLSYMLARLVLG